MKEQGGSFSELDLARLIVKEDIKKHLKRAEAYYGHDVHPDYARAEIRAKIAEVIYLRQFVEGSNHPAKEDRA